MKIIVNSELADWNLISRRTLTEEFMNKYKDKLNWNIISGKKLSENIIRKFQDYVNWDKISIKPYLSEDFIEEFKDKLNWDLLSTLTIWDEHLMRKFKNYINWDVLRMPQTLSEDFIREFQDKLNWNGVSAISNLSENFLREFSDKLNWLIISSHQKLSENFIRDFQEYVDWGNISCYQKLSEDFIREFQDKVNWKYISSHQRFSFKFALEFIEKLDIYVVYYQHYSIEEQTYLRQQLNKKNASTAVIDKIISIYNADPIQKRRGVFTFADFYQDLSINYDNNPEFYDAIINRFIKQINWHNLSTKSNLSKKFIEKYSQYINWTLYLDSLYRYDKNFLIKFINIQEVFDFLLKKRIISLDEIEFK